PVGLAHRAGALLELLGRLPARLLRRGELGLEALDAGAQLPQAPLLGAVGGEGAAPGRERKGEDREAGAGARSQHPLPNAPSLGRPPNASSARPPARRRGSGGRWASTRRPARTPAGFRSARSR